MRFDQNGLVEAGGPRRPWTIRRATQADVGGIVHVCSEGWRDTYRELRPKGYVERVIAEYNTPERIAGELKVTAEWNGWWVAMDDGGQVAGAGGGGMISEHDGELFVLGSGGCPGRTQAMGFRCLWEREGVAVLPVARIQGGWREAVARKPPG